MDELMTPGAWILMALFLILAVVTFPVWPHSLAWGYYPSFGVGVLLVLFVVLLLIGAFQPPRRGER